MDDSHKKSHYVTWGLPAINLPFGDDKHTTHLSSWGWLVYGFPNGMKSFLSWDLSPDLWLRNPAQVGIPIKIPWDSYETLFSVMGLYWDFAHQLVQDFAPRVLSQLDEKKAS